MAKMAWTGFLLSMSLAFYILRSNPTAEVVTQQQELAIFPATFWLALFAMLVFIALAFLFSRGIPARLFVSTAFVITLTLPMYWFEVYGSDGPSSLGMIELFLNTGRLDPSLQTYFQWPLFFFEASSTISVLGIAPSTFLQLMMSTIAIDFSIALFAVYERFLRSSATVGVILYFAGFYLFINWQAAPQTLALTFFVLSVLCFPRRGPSPVLLGILFAATVLLHPFVGLWLVLAVGFMTVVQMVSRKERTAVGTFILLLVVQTAVLIYQAAGFFGNLVQALSGYLRAALQIQLTQGAVANYAQLAQRLPNSPWDVALRLIGWANVGLVLALIALAGIRNLRRFFSSPIELGILLAGLTQVAAGIVTPVLGVRGIQAAVIPWPNKVAAAGVARAQRLFTLGVAIAIVLFVGNIVGIYSNTTTYQNDPGHDAAEFYRLYITPGMSNRSVVLTDHSMLTYLSGNAVSPSQLINLFFATPNDVVARAPYAVCSSNQLQAQLNALGYLQNANFSSYYDNLGSDYAVVYDSGVATWNLRLS